MNPKSARLLKAVWSTAGLATSCAVSFFETLAPAPQEEHASTVTVTSQQHAVEINGKVLVQIYCPAGIYVASIDIVPMQSNNKS
eukprot:gene17121-23424_t